jgi:hemolysin activation/secretion protein
VAVAGSLREGKNEHETDVVFKTTDKPWYRALLGVDDTGPRSTGSTRGTADLSINSPMHQGDLLTADLIYSDGSDYGRLAYSIPVGPDGWRVGANGSVFRYRLIAPEFSALGAGGSSDSAGLEAAYPIVRARLHNLYLNLNADHESFDNHSSGATTSRYDIDALGVALNANLFDSIGGGGASTASLALRGGRADLGGSPNQAADLATTRVAGNYARLRYAASRQQVLTPSLSFYGALSGQFTSKNLDSSEKFYLGGANGVRAYPANEGAGTEGQMLNLELRERLPANFQLDGFYDWGHVTVNRNNSFSGAATINNYSLQGAGLALGWQGPFGFSAKATWAHRLGHNPSPTASGNDQDGSLVRNRVWLIAGLSF